MSEDINLGDDIGYASVTISGNSIRLDVWECYARLMDTHQKHSSDYEGYCRDVASLLEEKGFGEVSLHLANRFAESIFARVAALKKSGEDSTSAASPASTEQESSTTSESPA